MTVKKIYLLSNISKYGAIHLPSIQIEFINSKIDFSTFDTIIFTSKNGVKAIDRISSDWQKKDAISVGIKTADEVQKLGGKNIFFEKKAYGNILAQTIIQKFSDRKFLYVRPKIVASNLTDILQKNGIYIAEKILYKTICRSVGKISTNPVFIATSPSTIKCLLKSKIPKNSIFVAIGKTTFQEIPDDFQKYISENQTIQSCLDLANKL